MSVFHALYKRSESVVFSRSFTEEAKASAAEEGAQPDPSGGADLGDESPRIYAGLPPPLPVFAEDMESPGERGAEPPGPILPSVRAGGGAGRSGAAG